MSPIEDRSALPVFALIVQQSGATLYKHLKEIGYTPGNDENIGTVVTDDAIYQVIVMTKDAYLHQKALEWVLSGPDLKFAYFPEEINGEVWKQRVLPTWKYEANKALAKGGTVQSRRMGRGFDKE